MCRPLVRRLRLISGFCSSARTFDPRFLQTPPRDGSPCVSLTLHLHQVGWKTFTSELLSMPGTRLNRSRGRALRPAAGPCQQWMERWERLARCDWRCSDYGEGCIRRARNNSVGRCHVEIFVRPMRYKGCHQAHNAKVAICALFTTHNSLKLQGRRKVFSPIRKVRAISQKLYSHSGTTAANPHRI